MTTSLSRYEKMRIAVKAAYPFRFDKNLNKMRPGKFIDWVELTYDTISFCEPESNHGLVEAAVEQAKKPLERSCFNCAKGKIVIGENAEAKWSHMDCQHFKYSIVRLSNPQAQAIGEQWAQGIRAGRSERVRAACR